MNQQNDNNDQPVLPRRSRRLATILPASHWIGLGYSEADAQSMEELQNDMKKRSGDADIMLRGSGEGAPLPYHDRILPHWKKLAKALKGRTNVEFLIAGISLPILVLDVMFPALELAKITQLVLSRTDLGNDELERLISFLGDNKSLRYLGIGEDLLNDISIASSLSDSIQNHPSLEGVGFSSCGLNSHDVFEKVLEGCAGLESLSCTFEELGLDVTCISNFIGSNHPLERLTLKHCKITDSDVLQLTAALKKNTNLEQLGLEDNDITAEGEKVLLKAMYDPTSMDSIVDSNHKCISYSYDIFNESILEQRLPLEIEVISINLADVSIQWKIREKVILALCGMDGGLFDLSHFNDLPLGVMPSVLELIQKHFDARTRQSDEMQLEKDALSRLFHTLRGWELPLLFTNLNKSSANTKRKRRKTRR